MTAPLKLSALEVPEVLVLIFAQLGRHALRVHASLVCRLWYKVAAPILRARPLAWSRHPHDAETKAVLRKRLQETKTLVVKRPNYLGAYTVIPMIWEHTPGWIELTKQLSALSDTRQLQITELTIFQRLQRDTLVFSILTTVGPQLTRLRLENMSRSNDVPLDRILVLCSRLVVIHVHYADVAYYHDYYVDIRPHSQQSILPSRLDLRSLTLENIGIEERSLLRLLGSCPDLGELKLIRLLQGWPLDDESMVPIGATNESLVSFSKQPFLEQIAGLCPLVWSVHLSGGADPSWRVDTAMLTLQLFPIVTHWSFHSSNTGAMLKALKTPHLKTLTSIEILHTTVRPDITGNLLHQYLCEAPHLIHLKAQDIIFPIMWFDLEGILDAQGRYHRDSPPPSYSYAMVNIIGRYIEPFHRKIWACRNLQTLHIQLDARQGDNVSDERSRVLFGYLSRVCPRLQDLAIKHPRMRLSLEGGFCLLARLRELKRLSLMIATHYRKYIRSMDWIARIMTPVQKFKIVARIEMLTLLSDRRTVYARTPFSSTDVVPSSSSSSSESSESESAVSAASLSSSSLTLSSCTPFNKTLENQRRSGGGGHTLDSGGGKYEDIHMAAATAVADNSDVDGEENDPNTGGGGGGGLDYMIDGVDMRNVGRWKDVKSLFEDRFSKNWVCWPVLEYMELIPTDSHRPKFDKVKPMIRRLRPDVDVV
ncbi:hypothetical protein BGZ65_002987 [Modicella reniformis]|uniref:F-box domain-containing protein n=1 Tax=Modicella reniformis TaxID=1440133 RepID=A0A9P6ILE3_9FUNG|nr:hypothetical protein BGZ65_002987 [Modicella reniformis]